jgi:hypothetical protein
MPDLDYGIPDRALRSDRPLRVENVLGATTPGRGKTAFFPPLYGTLVISTPCGLPNTISGSRTAFSEMAMVRTTSAFSLPLIIVVVLFLACSFMPAHASSGPSKAPEPKPSACTASEPFEDESSDIQAVVSYKAAIRRLYCGRRIRWTGLHRQHRSNQPG